MKFEVLKCFKLSIFLNSREITAAVLSVSKDSDVMHFDIYLLIWFELSMLVDFI